MKKILSQHFIKSLLIALATLLPLKADTLPKNNPLIFFRPALSVSVRNPIGISGKYWKKYNAAGLKFEFPSKIKDLQCLAAFETGHVFNKFETASVYLLHIYFGAQYSYATPLKWFKLIPQLSITNTMFSDFNVFDALFKTDRISFADVENEYGIRAGLEPRFVYKNFFLGIPVIIERTFSSPDRFDLFLITINAGYTFKL